MAKKGLSRRDFLKLTGVSSAALAAAGLPLGSVWGAPRRQDLTTITFGGWGGVAEDEGVQAAIEVFQEENPNILVEWQHTPEAGDYNTVLLTNFAAGTAPDTSFIVADAYETYRQEGLLMDITDQIVDDPLLGQEDYFIQPQEGDRCADDEGRWHGIGSCWVAPHIYYNAEMFDDAGIDPPGFKDDELWEWDDFVDICKQFTVDSRGRHPDDSGFDPDDIQIWAVDWPLWWIPIASAIYANGGSYIEDGRVAIDSEEAIDAMQRLSDLIYVHHVAPRSASLSDLGMTNTQMIDTGRLAMAVDGSWALSWMNPSMVSVPLGTGGLPKMVKPATLMQAHFHSVISSTQHPEEAWQWVRFLATPFYQTEFLKIGLWLPSQTALTTEQGLSTWLTEGIHPDNYVDCVTQYIPQHGVALRLPPGYIEASTNYLTPAFDAIAAGEAPADVIPDAVEQSNAIIESMMM